jgi:hypothetical protein
MEEIDKYFESFTHAQTIHITFQSQTVVFITISLSLYLGTFSQQHAKPGEDECESSVRSNVSNFGVPRHGMDVATAGK